MKKNEKSPRKERPNPEDICSEEQRKDNQISFKNPQRQRLYNLFIAGGQYSVVQLVVNCRIPDPRSHIRYIKAEGVQISSYWQRSEFSRYKVYFIHKGQATDPTKEREGRTNEYEI